ncbi:MAG TPA: sugar ABC transporter permease, partial [Ktedonobacterales bacterium]|nr:sugar ABC transporter permease [Ktedonobacterales bacterium]
METMHTAVASDEPTQAGATPSAPQARQTSVRLPRLPGGLGRFRWRKLSRQLVPYVFLLPFLAVFAAFFFAPFIYALSQSFYKEESSGLGFGPSKIVWVGLQNYSTALHDPNFWDGIKRVILFGAVQIPIMMGVALTLALLMDSAVIRFQRFFRLAFFVPYAVPGVVATIMWSFFYSPDASPIVAIFNALHLVPPAFYSPGTVLWSIANISTWEFT